MEEPSRELELSCSMSTEAKKQLMKRISDRLKLSEQDLHLGNVAETGWHTLFAEVLDTKGDVYMVVELDPDTLAGIRYRRPSPHPFAHCH